MARRRVLVAAVALVVTAVSFLGGGRAAVAESIPDTGGPYSGIPGEPIPMSAVNSVNAVSWRWDFGDGTTASGMRVTKTYYYPGVYYVVLTTTDPAGVVTSTYSFAYIRGDAAIVDLRPYGCTWVYVNGYITCAPYGYPGYSLP